VVKKIFKILTGNSNPKWASLNNAIFVCLKCAGLHRSFGINVSFIRSLTIDSWDEKQIEYLIRGGNKRLREFLYEFQVPDNATMDFKYMIRASDYYRKLLKSEVYNNESPYRPDLISGLEMIDYGINANPNFDNQTPICSSNYIPKHINSNKESNIQKGFFGKVGGFLNLAKDKVNSTASIVGTKIKGMEIGEKLKAAGGGAYFAAKETGTFVVAKGKEAYV
jgi:hypothetical protein